MKKTGKGGITVTIIKDSISEFSDRITTFELEYPRFIHGELMSHRMFSRNAMSSRAVPVSKMIQQVRSTPAMPIHWGKNQAGMQATEECYNMIEDNITEDTCNSYSRDDWWKACAAQSSVSAECMLEAGYHKQIVNRLLEPFQMMKTIVTATEYMNFFDLRCHPDAQPEMKELADLMKVLMYDSEPNLLKKGEWHLPYIEGGGCDYFIELSNSKGEPIIKHLLLEEALKVSASCCAQVSYRLLDNSVEKAIMIYDKLIKSKPIHASPFEHCAKVMSSEGFCLCEPDLPLEKGVTHTDLNGDYWSSNFKGWIQYRNLM